jgi:hypothetical protein
LFSPYFTLFEQLKRKETFYWPKRGFFSFLDQLVCFLFQLLKTRKISAKNWRKQDSWFDVTNQILVSILYLTHRIQQAILKLRILNFGQFFTNQTKYFVFIFYSCCFPQNNLIGQKIRENSGFVVSASDVGFGEQDSLEIFNRNCYADTVNYFEDFHQN